MTLAEDILTTLDWMPGGISLYLLHRIAAPTERRYSVIRVLDELMKKDRVMCEHFFWKPWRDAELANTTSTDGPPVIGNPKYIGPVWEPAFAKCLWNKGLKIVQQYPADRYLLDIALVSEAGLKLDVEVDGRSTHCTKKGQRRCEDIVRDAALRAQGWKVLRFWVDELRVDMDGCALKVQQAWNDMMQKEKHK